MSDVEHQAAPADECETCGNPDEVLCDECALEEHLGDIERAEGLRSTPPGSLRAASERGDVPTFFVYWCPRCNVQTERSWHLCKRGPALIPQLDEETTCERIEVVPVWDGVIRGK